MSTPWDVADVGDQSGRTVVVTGANSGLGLVTARVLAESGATVVLAVRDTDRGVAAAGQIAGETRVEALDLADLASVEAFAERWQGPLDVLVNNAGVMAIPLARTPAGFEMQIGTNHLGHFALTNRLLPHIIDRVVTLSSINHRMGSIALDDVNWERRHYRRWAAYAQSKLANLLFTLELDRRLTAAGSVVRALAAHPGYSATNLQSRTGNPVMNAAMSVANKLFAQSDAMGALPTLYAATQDIHSGAYVGPDGPRETRGHPTLVGRSDKACDTEMAARLWSLSEQLTGVGFGLATDATPA